MESPLYPIYTSFREVNQTIKRILRTNAEAMGLSHVQFTILRLLQNCPDTNVTELAERIQQTNSSVSVAIEQLVGMGLVNRIRSDEDRRNVKLNLTDRGTEKVRLSMNEDSHLYKQLVRILEVPPQEIQNMLDTHQKILDRLNAKEE
ncbi:MULTISPECIES: MarR family transcriptional regulator [Paenibacillus]|uniref:MarR family winged helix-turn-helix transcriptional regulator n=1 Tax=Paenibacillus TaxID=44249 RepID=UPI00020D7EA8|nr:MULTISPECIES: MarR family transcriptional regulator [Paenibacillus]EGL19177.1 transcriptional regulator, MarR family [Paenibacillus sp. HGF7]EPD81129.1 hypothetical protein HMPREF1207_04886 [Paenibacillus sp. HGH0039]MBV6715016.1 MarR family transcriptional regulator [Paenibacillus chitinolyticus]